MHQTQKIDPLVSPTVPKPSRAAWLLPVAFVLPLLAVVGWVIWSVTVRLPVAASQRAALDQALLQAVVQEDTARVQALLAQGADPNVRPPDPALPRPPRRPWYYGLLVSLHLRPKPAPPPVPNTPPVLLTAAGNGDTEIVRALLGAGADPNARGPSDSARWQEGKSGATPLIECQWGGHEDITRLLLAHGADIRAHTDGGTTALQAAVWYGDRAIIRLLVARGADVSARDDTGMTILQMAGPPDIRALLKQAGAKR